MGMSRQRAVDYSGNGPFVDFDKKNDRGDFAVMKTLLSLFEDSALACPTERPPRHLERTYGRVMISTLSWTAHLARTINGTIK